MKSWRTDILVFDEDLQELKNYLLAGNAARKIIVVCDTNTVKYCLPNIEKIISPSQILYPIVIQAGEQNKTIDSAFLLWNEFTKHQVSKTDLILNLGGGMISDLGGFAASIYKRGIPFIHVPTTLLAQVDASIGGKTGIDWNGIKNMIGTIHAPEKVFISSAFLETLPQEEYNSGLAEAWKHGLIADSPYWKKLIGTPAIEKKELIKKSIAIKTEIVDEDPYEKNIRKKLNVGHSIGHALESFFLHQEKPILHGNAVAAGIICEAYISNKLGLLSNQELSLITTSIVKQFGKLSFNENDIEKITENVIHDKKNSGNHVLMVLLSGIGNALIDQPVSTDEINDALIYYSALQ